MLSHELVRNYLLGSLILFVKSEQGTGAEMIFRFLDFYVSASDRSVELIMNQKYLVYFFALAKYVTYNYGIGFANHHNG